MSAYARAKKALLTAVASNQLLYQICRQIVYRHDGDNDSDMFTNGERLLIERALPKARVIFDVGANIGEWLELASRINPSAQFHAFEPSASTYGVLAGRGFGDNVRLVNAGLGSTQRTSELFIYGAQWGTNSVYERHGVGLDVRSREAIELITLDGYCREHNIESIDFMKIDVEGHELAVLQGATEMLRTGRIGLITFEYGGTFIDARALLADVWALVESANSRYRFYKLFHDGPRYIPSYQQDLETFRYSNWLLVSPERESWITTGR